MKQVLNDIIQMYPAQEYGLILWSHGTSWLPAGSSLRSFGEDSGEQMNIPDLAENLPIKFDFILFDACLMVSVEVVYDGIRYPVLLRIELLYSASGEGGLK